MTKVKRAANASAQTIDPTDAPAPMVPTNAPEPEPTPAFADADEAADEAADPDTDTDDEPLPKEYVVLVANASYGPVVIGGVRARAFMNKLYHVPNAEERADILGTGRFRAGTKADLARSLAPSAGPGGAFTRDLLPPGAIKGGLQK